ncbi:MAG: substrate-binding domain-containing protein [Oscillospiraceae bacterium]|nr:substrate-binding domain-containing protein [Oscillospiraceae bacterium]
MKKFAICALAAVIILSVLSGCSAYEHEPLTDYASVPEEQLANASVTVNFEDLGSSVYIPVIVSGLDNSVWLSLQAGIDEAAKDYNINVEYFVSTSADAKTQEAAFRTALTRSPDAVCLYSTDYSSLTNYINKLKAADIPIILLDDSMPDIAAAYCRPSGYTVGEESAHRICEAIDMKGKIAVAATNWSDTNITKMVEGFKTTVEQNYPDVEVINMPNNPKLTSYAQCSQFLSANPSLDAVFSTDSVIFDSMVNAARTLPNSGSSDIIFSGIGANYSLKYALSTEDAYGTFVLNYTSWGYNAKNTDFSASIGGEFDTVILNEYVWVNAKNMSLPTIQSLLNY